MPIFLVTLNHWLNFCRLRRARLAFGSLKFSANFPDSQDLSLRSSDPYSGISGSDLSLICSRIKIPKILENVQELRQLEIVKPGAAE